MACERELEIKSTICGSSDPKLIRYPNVFFLNGEITQISCDSIASSGICTRADKDGTVCQLLRPVSVGVFGNFNFDISGFSGKSFELLIQLVRQNPNRDIPKILIMQTLGFDPTNRSLEAAITRANQVLTPRVYSPRPYHLRWDGNSNPSSLKSVS